MKVGDILYMYLKDDPDSDYRIAKIINTHSDNFACMITIVYIIPAVSGERAFFVPKDITRIDKEFVECYGMMVTTNEQAFVKWLGKYADR
jgi:hypothetical protein